MKNDSFYELKELVAALKPEEIDVAKKFIAMLSNNLLAMEDASKVVKFDDSQMIFTENHDRMAKSAHLNSCSY